MKKCLSHIAFLSILVGLMGCAPKALVTTDGKPANDHPSTEMRSGIITHEGLVFRLTPPHAWELDTESGRPNGVPVVFYPEGTSWRDSKTVMYVSVTAKRDGETVDSLIEQDVQRFREGDSRVVIADLPDQTVGKRQVKVKSFFGQSPENYEAVAYIDEKQHVVFLVLSARNTEAFESSLPMFSELAGSYFLLGTQ